MKYLFTLLATCLVLGLSAQVSSDSVTKLIDNQIELVKSDLAAQNNKLVQNERLTPNDKLNLKENLTLTQDQIESIKDALQENAKAMLSLTNSDIANLEKNERLLGLEAQRDHIVYQALNPQQQTAFRQAVKMNR